MRHIAFVLMSLLCLTSTGSAQQVVNPHGPLSVPCAACHAPNAWKPVQVTEAFRHAPQTFPLEGAHARTTCTGCHKRLDFKGVSPKCASCHEDVHKGELGVDCARCHTPRSFAEEPAMKQAHELTRFPLRGAHAAAECSACHTPSSSGRLQFVGKSTTCAGCHAADARGVAVPDHQAAGFIRECTACHSINTWKNPRFDHAQTAFPLLGAHQAATCEGCHADRVYRGKDRQCVSCHRADFDQVTTPRHVDGFPTTCADCHGNTAWKGARFDHNTSRFPLTGAHGATTCSGCHADGVFRGKAMDCVSCHQTTYQATTAPPHGAAGFGTTCTSCHNTTAWLGAPFDHATTRFTLTGAHRAVSCTGCHADRVYHGKPMDCASCHQSNFQATTNPPHSAAGFTAPCTTCHTTTAWGVASYNHDATRFPLTGTHRSTTCAGCHADNVFRGKPTTCVSCHRPDYDRTTTPPHAGGFPTACESCHATTTWTGATFDHAQSDFPLTGAHRTTSCTGCHGDGVFNGKTTDCVTCHRARYDATLRPAHGPAGFSTTCTTCHNTTAWPGTPFNHAMTRFALTGAHLATTCQGCHADGVYRGRPMDCLSCHRPDYDGTRTPPHGASSIGTTCTSCHTTATWVGGTYDHAVTSFPLTGAHRAATCAGCHADGVYQGKPSTCYSCHRPDYDGTQTPPHAAAGYSTTCTTCHTTTAWLGSTFNHATTRFPLTGAHVAATCQGCHADGVYRGKPSACVSCHRTDYDGTTNPNHGSSSFPTTCTTCHTTTAWAGGTFDHGATAFPLTGAHRAATCTNCHGDGVYRGKPAACQSCHQPEYAATTRPPHGVSGIGTTCSSCHTTTAWAGGTYNHSVTTFPLTGAHTTTPCASCHGDGVYRGKSSVCSSCHQTDYNQTTNPNHVAALFPNTCASCHTTTTWLGATFNHDAAYFPIYTGKHRGKWTTCATCHTSPTNFQVFTCLTCHEHSKTKMDDKHKNRSGYSYDSQRCYACHPRGNS